jgi:hypothetical protein
MNDLETVLHENETLLREAILEKRPIYAVYQGFRRWLCPHVLGYKGNRLQLLAYQYSGESASGAIATPPDPEYGPPQNWRCMDVAQIESLALLQPGDWFTSIRRGGGQSCVYHVVAQVTDFPE